ncbi:MAG: MBL fold metallo-hydrolase [Actinomycetia bacterium]|nr:MBL fold metallo-hydrolase [Actinomycetes bacterium]
MTVTALILGSGQDGGSPQVGTWGDGGIERSASSVAIITQDGAALLFDVSPDFRMQYQFLASYMGEVPALDGVFITHGHMGHYAGLVHFGMEAAATESLPLFAPRSVLDYLSANEPWATLITDKRLAPIEIDDATATIGGVSVLAVPVPHRGEYTGTVGFSVLVHGRPWLLYLPDIDGWDVWPAAIDTIADHDVAIIDATFSSLDELPHRDLLAIKHPLVSDTIARFAHLTKTTSIVLSHINHSNPLGKADAAITQQAEDAGFVIARDGMVIPRA